MIHIEEGTIKIHGSNHSLYQEIVAATAEAVLHISKRDIKAATTLAMSLNTSIITSIVTTLTSQKYKDSGLNVCLPPEIKALVDMEQAQKKAQKKKETEQDQAQKPPTGGTDATADVQDSISFDDLMRGVLDPPASDDGDAQSEPQDGPEPPKQ